MCAYVAPHLVDGENPLAGVEDVFNAITVKGNAIGDVMFYGRGAGKLPTASAVVADVMDAARHQDAKKRMVWAEGGEDVTVSPDRSGERLVCPGGGHGGGRAAAFPGCALLPRAGAPEEEFAFLTAAHDPLRAGGQLAGLQALLRVPGAGLTGPRPHRMTRERISPEV